MSYEIRRFFKDPDKEYEVILDGLTLEEVQEYCNSDESSSRTARSFEARVRTQKFGEWFDGWVQVDDD